MNHLVPTDITDLRIFVKMWHGEPTMDNPSFVAQDLAPDCLIEWHEICAQWDGVAMRHNYPIPLHQLKVEDGLVPFLVENQGTSKWAFDASSPRSPVFHSALSAGANTWTPAGEDLQNFLIHATILEAAIDSPAMKVAQNVDDAELVTIRSRAETPFPAWIWARGESQLLISKDWLGIVEDSVNSGSGQDIALAAKTMEGLAWADAETSIKWRGFGSAEASIKAEPLPF